MPTATNTPHFHVEAREALEAARVFTTPLERLKNWNAFKEDAARRMSAALAQLSAPKSPPASRAQSS